MEVVIVSKKKPKIGCKTSRLHEFMNQVLHTPKLANKMLVYAVGVSGKDVVSSFYNTLRVA